VSVVPRILDAVKSPADLHVLTTDELSILAGEIRNQIIATTSHTGGHVASSLGAVEIILAAHSLLNCPRDKFIFDVGHQSYAHKLVTGRLDAFDTLRTYQGISGFPKPQESPYDVHASGHASDSLSIAVGLAKARDMRGGDEKIMALIGDASIAGGMAFEALNCIGQAQTQMVILLNDNEMSISRNVGALMKHFGALRTKSGYRTTRDTLQERLETSNQALKTLLDWGRRAKDSTKQFFIPHMMIYEQLGIICTAPINGHDIAELREIMNVALEANAPVLVHCVTEKGAGYGPALKNPERFHGVGSYDIITGEDSPAKDPSTPPTYTSVFSKAIVEEAKHDPNFVAFTAAMQSGTGLKEFARLYPNRFIDGGIAEANVVGMASGVSLAGMKSVVAIYSTFLQRAVDQMIVNAALNETDIVFAIDRAGLVGDDGPTHHGVFDMVYARMIPGMRMIAPSNEAELVNALHTALATGGVFAIRYPRGAAEGVAVPEEPVVLPEGVSAEVVAGEDVAILAFGRMVSHACRAAEMLREQGISARVVDMRWVKPLDRAAIAKAAQTKLVVTVEEGALMGGAGSGVLEELSSLGLCPATLRLGIPDSFVCHGNTNILLHELGLDADGIASSIARAYAAL